MTDHFKTIYAKKAAQYEQMVAREDMHGNLFAALMEIAPFSGLNVVEFGAGTGRVTRLMSVLAAHIYAFDISAHMLQTAAQSLELSGMTNWSLAVGDNHELPVASNSADIAIEGWSFGHVTGWSPEKWQPEADAMLSEMQRVLRPGGTAVLIETMGTGKRQPEPPGDGLRELYARWEQKHGFQYRWVRTDYQFASVDEAAQLTRFFFGDALADEIVAKQMTILPECTGLWWRTYD